MEQGALNPIRNRLISLRTRYKESGAKRNQWTVSRRLQSSTCLNARNQLGQFLFTLGRDKIFFARFRVMLGQIGF